MNNLVLLVVTSFCTMSSWFYNFYKNIFFHQFVIQLLWEVRNVINNSYMNDTTLNHKCTFLTFTSHNNSRVLNIKTLITWNITPQFSTDINKIQSINPKLRTKHQARILDVWNSDNHSLEQWYTRYFLSNS